MQLSRPKSAQLPSHRHRSDAAGCSALQECPARQLPNDSAADLGSHHRHKKLQDTCVEGMASSHHGSDSNNAASTAAHQATSSVVHGAKAADKQSTHAVADEQHTADHAAQHQLEHLQSWLPESSSEVLTSEASSQTDPASTLGVRRSGLQGGSEEHVHAQTGRCNMQTARGQQWPPKGARWRNASLYKLQARPLHVPTAKVRSCNTCSCHLTLRTCTTAQPSCSMYSDGKHQDALMLQLVYTGCANFHPVMLLSALHADDHACDPMPCQDVHFIKGRMG